MDKSVIKNYPRYESYKDSGVEWLGEIPEEWELGKISSFFTERRTKVSDKDYPALSVTKLGVFPQWDNVAKSNDGDNRKLVKKGDFVINSRSDRKGSSGTAKTDGSVSLINIVLKPKGIEPRFSEYLFKSNGFIEEFYRVGHGIVADLWTTRFDNIKNSLISLPSYDEQTKVANFLDQKTKKIDQAISLKQQQISKLEEYKQIVIQNAVTKGLNSDVPMKDSGVDWLGMIPEHWGMKKGKWLFLKMDRPVREDDRIVTCFRDGEVTLRSNRRTEGFTNALKEHGYQGVRKGDLVIHQMDAFAGAIGISDSDGKSTPVYSVCTPKDCNEVSVKYYVYLLRGLAYNGFILSLAKGIRERSTDFRFKDFSSLELPLPPYKTQLAISEFIEEKIAQINLVIENNAQQIDRLKEYKTVLINKAVTGKIKVA